MTRIRVSEQILGAMKVQADMWHRSRGDGRVRVVRIYRMHSTRDGSNAQEYLLTRYEDNRREAASSILMVEGTGYELTFTEVCRDIRRNEGKMINAWHASHGAMKELPE